MYKKRALVLGGYLSLLALAACGPKVIDDSDLVSIDYKYMLSDGTVVEQGTKDFTVGSAGDLAWVENMVRGAKQDDEFSGRINGSDIFGSEYDSSKIQSYPAVIMREAMQIENPEVGTEIDINSMGHGVIKSIGQSSDGYDEYVVDFNDPKTYSELSYSIKVASIEKN